VSDANYDRRGTGGLAVPAGRAARTECAPYLFRCPLQQFGDLNGVQRSAFQQLIA
jgi:hypothetical protein